MDLIDRLQELSARAAKLVEQLQTEEATKNALVMPFIQCLGYNVFDPTEVVPEFTADVGIKKGEKVDYAVMQDGKSILLFECKTAGTDLAQVHASQLYRYFSVTEARFGILTNGIHYQFYSDLDSPNKMDDRPFLEVNLLSIDANMAEQLKKFAKETFDVEDILSTASDLKYTRGIKRILGEEWVNPTEDFVRLLAGRIYSGRFTQAVKEQFTEITKRAFHSFVNDQVNRRLKSALDRETTTAAEAGPTEDTGEELEEEAERDIETTEEEMEGFYIVRAIVREVIDADRVFMRDTMSYCGILADDNNRKPICRLFFNSPTSRYIGIVDEEKNVERHKIESLTDIYKFSEALKAAAQRYA